MQSIPYYHVHKFSCHPILSQQSFEIDSHKLSIQCFYRVHPSQGRKNNLASSKAQSMSAVWLCVCGATKSHFSHLNQVALAFATVSIPFQYVTLHRGSWSHPSLYLWSTSDWAPFSHACLAADSSFSRKCSLGMGLSLRWSRVMWGTSLLNHVSALYRGQPDSTQDMTFHIRSPMVRLGGGILDISC